MEREMTARSLTVHDENLNSNPMDTFSLPCNRSVERNGPVHGNQLVVDLSHWRTSGMDSRR